MADILEPRRGKTFTSRSASKYLRCSIWLVNNLRKEGYLKAYDQVGNSYLYTQEALDECARAYINKKNEGVLYVN